MNVNLRQKQISLHTGMTSRRLEETEPQNRTSIEGSGESSGEGISFDRDGNTSKPTSQCGQYSGEGEDKEEERLGESGEHGEDVGHLLGRVVVAERQQERQQTTHLKTTSQ